MHVQSKARPKKHEMKASGLTGSSEGKVGWLSKRGEKGFSWYLDYNWMKRWFKLEIGEAGWELRYFASDSEEIPLGVFSLSQEGEQFVVCTLIDRDSSDFF